MIEECVKILDILTCELASVANSQLLKDISKKLGEVAGDVEDVKYGVRDVMVKETDYQLRGIIDDAKEVVNLKTKPLEVRPIIRKTDGIEYVSRV